jgi:hypothetical protein
LYNIELVRTLCQKITAEKDEARARDLMSLLKAVIEEDHEEIRVRMAFLNKQYLTESPQLT